MSLPPAQMLAALGMAQMTTVTPALEGRYEGGSAGTIGLLLILLAQDAATAVAREAAEVAAMRDLLNRTDGTHAELLTALETKLGFVPEPVPVEKKRPLSPK